MYAETFKVQSWLETQAKWLRWAMQSLANRNLEDVRYNLQKFWETLAEAKRKASSPRDWGDVLLMDSQSQWTLGTLYQADQSELLKKLNSWFGAEDQVAITKQQVERLGASAGKAFEAQKSLAEQSAGAYRQAGVTDNQAAGTMTVGSRAITANANDTRVAVRQAEIISRPVSLAEVFGESFFGVPLWVWVGGAAALAVMVTAAPTILRPSPSRGSAAA